jgi:V/A-type H+/Na+-transporting ATPase subunit D
VAKIKKTKNALKSQRDAMSRFERFLPTLELKKQQLQAEVRHVDAAIRGKAGEEETLRRALHSWIKLFSAAAEASVVDVTGLVRLVEVRQTTGNIAGVNVPAFEEAVFARAPIDYFSAPPWAEDAAEVLEKLMRLRAERLLLEEQKRLLGEELRITSQRVNLFEKVKIPECKENIRVIHIALGDAQTAGVARAKMAKSKTGDLASAVS